MSAPIFRGGREGKRSRWSRLYQQRREALLDMLGRKCKHCGANDNLTFDHIRPADWPRNRYSSHERLRLYLQEAKIGNIQILCHRCNPSKGHRTEQLHLTNYVNAA